MCFGDKGALILTRRCIPAGKRNRQSEFWERYAVEYSLAAVEEEFQVPEHASVTN